jgi:hypothetical protein
MLPEEIKTENGGLGKMNRWNNFKNKVTINKSGTRIQPE